jgi:CubicO group peptidase (beta-lactamase class C family)
MTARIEAEMASSRTTGLSIALVDGDTVVWARGFGYADVEAGRAVDAETVFEIGSVTKTLAATTVMQLVEEGRLGLDDRLDALVPGFRIGQGPFSSGPITLRSVLDHHSGIPGDLFNGSFTTDAPFDYDAWLLGWLARETTSAPVGAVFAYSNSGFALLRPVIERAAPEGFVARSNALFDAMGMRSTSYARDARIPAERLSRGYSEGVVQPDLYGNLSTAGSILSTASDMARYIRMIHAGGLGENGRVLATASLDRMFTPQNGDSPFDGDLRVGLSWFLGPEGYYAGRRVEHEGATPWFHSMLRILVDQRLGVVVLSNTTDADVARIAQETLELALQEKTGRVRPTPAPAPSEQDPGWTRERLHALAGTYVGNVGLGIVTFTVTDVDGGLAFSNQPGLWVPRRNGWFSLPDGVADPQRIQFRFATVDGKDVIDLLQGGARTLYAARFVQGDPAALAAWQARTGRYVATNLNPGAELWPGTSSFFLAVDEDGILRLYGTLRGNVALTPTSGEAALVAGLGRNRGESVRAVTVDGREQVELWGYRYRRTP